MFDADSLVVEFTTNALMLFAECYEQLCGVLLGVLGTLVSRSIGLRKDDSRVAKICQSACLLGLSVVVEAVRLLLSY